MRRKTIHKLLASAMAASVLLSVAGCGQNGNVAESTENKTQTENRKETKEGSNAEAAAGEKQEVKEPIEVSVAAIDTHAGMSNSGEYGDEIRSKLEEVCGV